MFIIYKANPAATPIRVVNPASYKYKWPLLCSKWPKVTDNMTRKIMISISVDKTTSSSSSSLSGPISCSASPTPKYSFPLKSKSD